MTDENRSSVKPPRLALLSNFQTRNLGNLILTTVIQRVLGLSYAEQPLIALHRLNHAVARTVTRQPIEQWVPKLQHALNPIDALREDALPLGERSPVRPSSHREEADPGWLRAASRQLVQTRPALQVRARAGRKDARAHVAAMLAADDIVWNAAGEIYAHGRPFGRLLELEIALANRKATAIVNFSFEPGPEVVSAFQRILPRLSLAISRDLRTADALKAFGMPADRIGVSPDAAFLIGSSLAPEFAPNPTATKQDAVGIVLHGATPIDIDNWSAVVRIARQAGLQVHILSSHLQVDRTSIEQLVHAVGSEGVLVLPEFTDAASYCRHLSGLQLVVTGRFHTAVMSIVSQTAVVGVDTYGTKVAGGLQLAGFGDSVATGTNWSRAVERHIHHPLVAEHDRLEDCRRRVIDAYTSRFPLTPLSS